MSGASADRPDLLASKVVAAIEQLGRARRAERQMSATEHGLTPLQVDLLTVLANGRPPEPTVGSLAVELAVSQPTATDSLRTLVDKGLIERRPDPEDRRRSFHDLTGDGRRVFRQLSEGGDAVLDAIGNTTVAEQAATLEALLQLIAGLVDSGAVTVARNCLTCSFHRHDNGVHHCTLLDLDLPKPALRVNCADHVAA